MAKPIGTTKKCSFSALTSFFMLNQVQEESKAAPKAKIVPIKCFLKLYSVSGYYDCWNGFCINTIPMKAVKTATQSKFERFSLRTYLAPIEVNTGLVQYITVASENEIYCKLKMQITFASIPKKHRIRKAALTSFGMGNKDSLMALRLAKHMGRSIRQIQYMVSQAFIGFFLYSDR